MDPEIIGKIAERKIQDAIEEGAFDNLPGKGKPIVFEDDPLTPSHLRMANRILKNAGVLPEWMQVQQELTQERNALETFRSRALQEHRKRFSASADLPPTHPRVVEFSVWHRKIRESYLRRLKAVNTGVLKLSLLAPSSVSSQPSYKLDAEMAAFDAVFPALACEDALTDTPETRESDLKRRARERYEIGQTGAVTGWLKTARLTSRDQIAASDDFQPEEL